ncbi:conserved hypothetical protein [Ricinus communis]|uniref:Uncharacterized protein n=1 Tax=Ricinus communis TaxID=3988 RepID=B9S4Y3_RICCO|nr:conserved hypothetical protein [Ricinus communis]
MRGAVRAGRWATWARLHCVACCGTVRAGRDYIAIRGTVRAGRWAGGCIGLLLVRRRGCRKY